MFLDLENLTIEQLLEKQIELRQKLSQANSMGMSGPADQIQNMICLLYTSPSPRDS